MQQRHQLRHLCLGMCYLFGIQVVAPVSWYHHPSMVYLLSDVRHLDEEQDMTYWILQEHKVSCHLGEPESLSILTF